MMQTSPVYDAHVRFEHVRMGFGARTVFEDLNCGFPRGKISVLLGGSGSGKSTLLRLLGGLIRPTAGHIFVGDDEVTGAPEARLYAIRSKIGMLFQGGALLDSLTIFDNLALPLREHTEMSPVEIADAIRTQLAAVGLEKIEHLLPGQLSGGMLRRASLARAILREPEILLCDEPFSGLDPSSVKRIELLLARINQERGITVLVVSHHIASTLRLADHALLVLPGRTVEGKPADLRRSEDIEVADFFDEDLTPDDASPTGPGIVQP